MKTEKLMTVYVCDCCGELMLNQPNKMLTGANYNSSGVSYEPKVMGDYCEMCLQYAQWDWDMNNKNGFVSDRYDPYDEKIHAEEIEKMKNIKHEWNEMDEYGRLYR